MNDIEPIDSFSEVNLNKLEELAAINYSPEQIAIFFKCNPKEFIRRFNIPGSVLKEYYNRGRLVIKMQEGINMLQKSFDNITIAQRLDKLRQEVDIDNAKNEIIYGEF